MTLLVISPSFYPATYYGGPIFSLYNSVISLTKNGLQIFVSTTNCNGKKKLKVEVNKFLELEKNLFVKYYSSGTESGFSLRMFLTLWKDIKGKDCIYLVSIFSPPTPLVIFLNLFFRKPLILSPRGQLGEWCLNQGNHFKKLWLKLFNNPIANKITWEATSLSEKEMIKKVYPEARVEVIPPVINVEEFQNEKDKVEKEKVKDYTIYEKLTSGALVPMRRDEPEAQKKIIVSMGRLHKVKGFDILIEAIGMIERLVPNLFRDLVLLIAGEDFGERKNLEDLIDKLGLKERVFLVGMIEGEDKKEFLRNADVFVLASHHENFGIVYAESLASGVPVIASRNTPWQDVEKYNCGKWINNTPEDFARAITEILAGDLAQMGENGKKYIEENFSSDAIVKKYSQIFETILNVR